MTLVGTVKRNKTFLPCNLQPTKERPVYSTKLAYHGDATVCSYVSKKKKYMHMSGEVEKTPISCARDNKILLQNKTRC